MDTSYYKPSIKGTDSNSWKFKPSEKTQNPDNNKRIYDSACTILDTVNEGEYSSVDELREGLRYHDSYEDSLFLLTSVSSIPDHPLSSVKEIIRGVAVIHDCLFNGTGYYDTDGVINIQETLKTQLSGSEYFLADKRLWNMPVITDSDFIDFRSFSIDDYDIIYGAFYYDDDYSKLYNYLSEMCNSASALILRRAWIDDLCKTINKTISNLQIISAHYNGTELRVFIPFLDMYEKPLSTTIRTLDFTLNVLGQIRESNERVIPKEPSEKAKYPIPRMKVLMEKWADNQNDDTELHRIIHNEMMRRENGHYTTSTPDDEYRTKIIGIQKRLYKDVKSEDEKPEVVSTIRRVGVLYCMLSQYGVDLTGMNKICSYVCADNKPFKGAKPENTIYTYLAHPEDRLFDKQDKIDYIKEKLEKYDVKVKGIKGLQ